VNYTNFIHKTYDVFSYNIYKIYRLLLVSGKSMYIPGEYREFISCAVLLHGAPVDVEGVIGDPRLFTVFPCLLHFRFGPHQPIDHFRWKLLEYTVISLRHFWPLASHSITVLKECKFGHDGTHLPRTGCKGVRCTRSKRMASTVFMPTFSVYIRCSLSFLSVTVDGSLPEVASSSIPVKSKLFPHGLGLEV